MATRPNAVPREYQPARNSEVKPVALIYKSKLTATGVQAAFEAENSTVDAQFVLDFADSIIALDSIVTAATIRSTNRDITKGILDASKKSVKYGKKLTLFLEKAFLPAQPGLFASFPVVAANDKMREGDTEGFLELVQTIINQINVPANKTALQAKGWPVQNLTDYQNLHTTVETLNTQQELAKQFIPENTDAATTVRNNCWKFVKELVKTKDLVYDEQPLQKHNWMVKTILNQIRSGGAGGVTVEVNANMGEIVELDISGVSDNPDGQVTVIVSSSSVILSAASGPGPVLGPTQWTLNVGTQVKTQEEFKTLIGYGGSNVFVKAQGLGPGVSGVKLVFAD
jgi:hypothetical protein